MPIENDGGSTKPKEKYWQRQTGKNVQKNAGKPHTQAKKCMKKYETYQYIVEATHVPNSKIN